MGTDLRYYPPLALGEVIVGGAVSRVVESRHPGFAPGDIVDDYTGWQDYAIAQGASARKVDPALGPLSTAIGVLGMPGLTAYLGLVKVGRPAPGDTVVISAASGAVGAVAGQVAKIAGCRVVGIAGGAEKLRYLTQARSASTMRSTATGTTCPAPSPRLVRTASTSTSRMSAGPSAMRSILCSPTVPAW